MATELKKQTAQYRLLHFQPDPEDGDRVCVGILLEEGRTFRVLFDKRFQKLRCIAPDFETELVSFYLRDLEDSLDRSPGEVDIALRRCVPQLLASEPRLIVTPVTEAMKLRLLARFVSPAKEPGRDVPLSSMETTVTEHMRSFLSKVAPRSTEGMLLNASPRDLFGKPLPNVTPVAFAIRGASKIVLVDGIDLRVMTPARAIRKTNTIVHTFWQYGRVQKESLFGQQPRIERIALVMNGTSPKTKPYLDAHDYALHQFNNEADVTVDTASGMNEERLRAVLATN